MPATIRVAGFDIPLIGLPENATMEVCDACRFEHPIRDTHYDGTHYLCNKCRAERKAEPHSPAVQTPMTLNRQPAPAEARSLEAAKRGCVVLQRFVSPPLQNANKTGLKINALSVLTQTRPCARLSHVAKSYNRPSGTRKLEREQTMKTISDKITCRNAADPYASGELGDLTEKQYAALATVARLSPGYTFEVLRYHGGPSSAATHVAIWSDGNDCDYVALVGKDCAQYYDSSKATEQVVKRVAHRVYRRAGLHFQ